MDTFIAIFTKDIIITLLIILNTSNLKYLC